MYGNIIRRIENESNYECLAAVLYLYNICSNIHNIAQYSTLLGLFNILLTVFDNKEHAERVVNALIEKSIAKKQLHIFTPDENHKNPFKYCEILKNNFKEDEKIYKQTYFDLNTQLDINIARCTFVDNSYFAKIIACTFFSDGVNIEKSTSELAVNLLKNNSSINLLLYGSPGAGKTEFAKTLAVQTGLQIFSFKNEMENNEENVLRQLNCLLSIEKKRFYYYCR
ncbi:ATP-binding protein [Treponema pedis]|uniref:ATP-binding protein n=1 Tax=Treponema pedis TaxID=409322 RepID=UPI001981ED09|nr:ATP-binding protein [Treponema pedis]QSI04313.1 ATP-binding protein [Treponema pedis]